MCRSKVRMDARIANAFIARRMAEGCRDSLRKYRCPLCGAYHITKASRMEDGADG